MALFQFFSLVIIVGISTHFGFQNSDIDSIYSKYSILCIHKILSSLMFIDVNVEHQA